MIPKTNGYLIKALNQLASLTAALTHHRFPTPARASLYGYSDHHPTPNKSSGTHRRRNPCRTECCVSQSKEV